MVSVLDGQAWQRSQGFVTELYLAIGEQGVSQGSSHGTSQGEEGDV